MRQIKFRVWDGGLMLPAESIQFDTETVEVLIPCDAFGCEGHPIEYDFGNVVLMQYTGLCDKNGKEIYEGDIVETDLGIGEVVFDAGAFLIRIPECDDYYEFDDFFSLYEGGCYLVEVIGNIYETPELLINE
ncbi:YopX family protein [Geobacillus stearothermophilus]|nr:YopX family protein [Geobacillus stearothermophilus]